MKKNRTCAVTRTSKNIDPEQTLRKKYIFRGIVQGVGFRPAVFRCATEMKLAGFVQNRKSEVIAEVEGSAGIVDEFPSRLRSYIPQAASLEDIRIEACDSKGEQGFRIKESCISDYIFPPIPPDLALCQDCRSELMDPEDRRYLYPFITCTQCGPRYSIVEDTPFDRENTSMTDFHQCKDCAREYGNPQDRRFHSQTNSCQRCGPRLTLKNRAGVQPPGDPLKGAIQALLDGKIVAIQGIGGFHLAVDPSFSNGIDRLRSDKERERKPFAVMVESLEEAETLCHLDMEAVAVLQSPESPILILPMRDKAPSYLRRVSDTQTLGIMLPYTPLHLLLFHHPEMDTPYRHLVMTSGNLKGEPIITDAGEAIRKLSDIADVFLFHNRRIIFRTDDSVIRLVSGQKKKRDSEVCQLRRSRGFVPKTINLVSSLEKRTLAVGGDLKNAPAFATGNSIYLSPYIGDLDNVKTFDAFKSQIAKILSLYKVELERVVFDNHPSYLSSRWALDQMEVEKVSVQHHHAHILSVMAEHDLQEQALGLSFDGTGYGSDGTIWGGEFLHAKRSGFRRLGSFKGFALPGGEAAVYHPKRIAFSILQDTDRRKLSLKEEERNLLEDMLRRGVHSPFTSSLGRIFDAAAAVLHLVDTVSYEGEGPIRLEGLALKELRKGAGKLDSQLLGPLLPLTRQTLQEALTSDDPQSGPDLDFLIDPLPLMQYLLEQGREKPAGTLALVFHQAVSLASLRGAEIMREITGLHKIALSGGVFQNTLLRELLVPALEHEDFEVFTNRSIPPGDGGLAVGQAFYQQE